MKTEYILLIAGASGVALATYLSFVIESIWIGFFISFAIGVIYLFLLYRWADSQFTSTSYKRMIATMLTLLVMLQSLSVISSYQKSVNQSETLNEVGLSIDQTMSQTTIEQDMIKALLHYHHEAEKDSRSITNSYKQIMGDKLSDDGMITYDENPNERMFYQASFPDSEMVVITIASNISSGEDSNFININNRSGKYQARVSLTPEGVNYVREN